jgi:transcriptional regulator with XRE-family HTH domain
VTLDDALVKFIADQLRERGWSQSDLAARLGSTQATISRLLSGKRRVRTLQWYADLAERAFGIPLSLVIAHLERRQAEAAMAQEIAILRAEMDALLKDRRPPEDE